jgi:hypothetical protein
LKNRIRQITDEKLTEVMQEIIDSKLTNGKEQETDELTVQLDVKDIY